MEGAGRRVEVADCRALPSSFTVRCQEDGKPVTVLANGSAFLYLLDPQTAQLLVNPSSQLNHVNSLASRRLG